MPETEIILDGFYPLVILGRFLGYFAFTNTGRVKSTSELRLKLLNFNVLFTLLFTFSINASYISSLADLKYAALKNDELATFTQTMIYILIVSYQILGMSMIVHANVKSRAFIDFLRQWNSVQSLLRCRRLIKLYGYFISVVVIILGGIYAVFHYTYYTEYNTGPITIIKIFKMLSMTISTTVCLYFGGLIVYFTKALQCCFEALDQELKDCLASESQWKTGLSVIRQRHELLVSLTNRFNSLLSPILICYLIIQSFSSCVSIYESMDLYLVQHSQNILENSRPAVKGVIRLIPIIAICLSSQMVSQQASSLIRHLASHPLQQLTTDSNFQLEMLRFQLQNRIPHITADSFLVLNNRLLGEITGVMATYIIIMLEISQGRSQ